MVIFEVNESISTILPTIAGLAKFCPNPPKSCFTITIDTKQPITACQNGSVTGRLSARRSPVRTALRSPIVCSFFIIILVTASNIIHESIQTAMSIKALSPKIIPEAITAGRSEAITHSIMRCVLMLSLT